VVTAIQSLTHETPLNFILPCDKYENVSSKRTAQVVGPNAGTFLEKLFYSITKYKIQQILHTERT
jgi:hypothetical protein